MDATTQYAVAGVILAFVLSFFLFQPTELVRWLQKKNYQYEVTFALYMLTPTEKFIFNSVLFLTLSMLLIACTVYLPDHIATISRRAYYYFAGDEAARCSLPSNPASLTPNDGSSVVCSAGAACDVAAGVFQAAVNTAAVAQDPVSQPAQTMGWV